MNLEPMLSVRKGSEALTFYKKAFQAQELFSATDPTGSVIAQLSIEGHSFWLADESPDHKNFSPETLHGSTVRLILTVDDPDAVFDRAIAAGATTICAVKDERYGWRIGRLRDPFGHDWEIGKPIPQV